MSEFVISLRARKFLFAIVGFSILFSLAYSFYYRIKPVVDARAYDTIARNILSGDGFREELKVSSEFDPAIVRAGPLYEYFLAGLYFIFAPTVEIIWIVQALLHGITALLIFYICRFLFSLNGERVGLLAAAIFGFHPDLIEISAMLMTETLYLFLAVILTLLFVMAYRNPEKRIYSAPLGIFAALAVLTRPPLLLFVPVILFFYATKKFYMSLGLFAIAFVAVMSPWVIRNYSNYHAFISTTLIGEYNLWVGNTLISNGGQISGNQNPAIEYSKEHGFLDFKKTARAEFRKFIIENPIKFFELCLIRVVRYFSLIRPMGFWFYQAGIGQAIFVATSLVSIVFLFIFGFSGMYELFKQKDRLHRYLVLFAILAPLPLFVATVESRYRFQIYPYLSIFAAYFLTDFMVLKTRRVKIITGTLLVLIAISLIDVYNFWPTVYSRISELLLVN